MYSANCSPCSSGASFAAFFSSVIRSSTAEVPSQHSTVYSSSVLPPLKLLSTHAFTNSSHFFEVFSG